MAKPELGNKRVCVSCAAKFFDLLKQPAVCPKCSTEQPAEQPRLKRAPGGNIPDDKRRPKPAVVPGLEGAEVEVEVEDDEDAEEDVLEDTSDLEDDADGIEVEVETEGNDEER